MKELLGHSTVITTQRYAHPGRNSKHEAIARLSDVGYDTETKETGGKFTGHKSVTIKEDGESSKSI